MKIQAFIFNWNNNTPNTLKLEKELSNLHKTIVINSNINESRSHWINLNNAYFSEQWNALLENIDLNTDFIFHIQSDAYCNNINNLFKLFTEVNNNYKIGVYAPNIDFTHHTYDLKKLKKYEDNLYFVPNTDDTCWFVNTKLINKNPLFNLNTNKLGYGCDWYYIAKSILESYDVIRDYRITVNHPKGTNYNQNVASQEFSNWIMDQNKDLQDKIHYLVKLRENSLL